MSETQGETNMELVRDGFEALAEGGYEALLPLISDDFVMKTPSDLASEPDTYRGKEGVRRWWESFYEAMDEVRLELGEMRAVGDLVATESTIVARGRSTGLEVSQSVALLWEIRDGQAVGIEFFATLDEAVEAVSNR